MKVLDFILTLLGYRREEDHSYGVSADLHAVLLDLAEEEQRTVVELQEELLETAKVQRNTREALLQRWESLSPREQDVAALTCLGYTNREIAARLYLSTGTIKAYVRQVLSKFNLHSKDELRMLIGHWDFRAWENGTQDMGPP